MFFTFNQNNSGGSFKVDLPNGIGSTVIVEADDYEEANKRAEQIGIYFDGVDKCMDCECCGDRWYAIWFDERGDETPSIYGNPIESYKSFLYRTDAFIHYKDGTIRHVVFDSK